MSFAIYKTMSLSLHDIIANLFLESMILKLNVARMDMENVPTCNHITKGVFLKPAEFVV